MRLAVLAAVLAVAVPAHAQTASIAGNVSALVDHLANMDATELRLRALADAQVEARPWLRFRFAGLADGLVADRGPTVRDAQADALEAWIEVSGARADLRAGMSRLAWGRLDEVQPTDVVNPIDVARYLLDGRSEARIALPLVRARVFPNDHFTLEGVVVPVFRPGTFDRLDDTTSPFNLFLDIPPPSCPPGVPCPAEWQFVHDVPDAGEMQAGGRLSVTAGRIDVSVSAWRGFVPFALLTGVLPQIPPALRLSHPRYTMIGGDFETVQGKWAIRGEAAYFPNRPLQIEDQPATFLGDSFEAGAGIDRRAGDFTLSATLLFRRTEAFAGDPLTSLSFVGGFSRTFNRDRIETRVFSLVNPEDRAGFVRGVMAWKPIDDVAVETSIGWFIGDGNDVITRFGDRDFAYVRLKYYFGR